eukprot:11139605-Karenia_brevis.AAC.1
MLREEVIRLLRVEMIPGDLSWNREVALGQIDRELSYLVRDIIKRDDVQRFPDSWDPREDHL